MTVCLEILNGQLKPFDNVSVVIGAIPSGFDADDARSKFVCVCLFVYSFVVVVVVVVVVVYSIIQHKCSRS